MIGLILLIILALSWIWIIGGPFLSRNRQDYIGKEVTIELVEKKNEDSEKEKTWDHMLSKFFYCKLNLVIGPSSKLVNQLQYLKVFSFLTMVLLNFFLSWVSKHLKQTYRDYENAKHQHLA